MPNTKRRQSFAGASPEKSSTSCVKQSSSTRGIDQRHVHFRETVSVRPIIHLDDISDAEKRDAWFCPKDFAQMKADFRRRRRRRISNTAAGNTPAQAKRPRSGECHSARGRSLPRRRKNKQQQLSTTFSWTTTSRNKMFCVSIKSFYERCLSRHSLQARKQ